MRQHFVDANILLTPTFCRLEYFTEAKILLTRIFCRRQHFVDMNILSTPTFCRREYFVATVGNTDPDPKLTDLTYPNIPGRFEKWTFGNLNILSPGCSIT
jgi:hypothetical protein